MGRTVWHAETVDGWEPAWSQLTKRRTTQDKIVKRWDGLRVVDDKYENKDDPRPDPSKLFFDDPTPVMDALPRPYGQEYPVFPLVDHDRDHHVIAVISGHPRVQVLETENIIALVAADANGTNAEISDHSGREASVDLSVPAYTGGSYLYLLSTAPRRITDIRMGFGLNAVGAWMEINNQASIAVENQVRSHLGVKSTVDFNVLRTNNELSDAFANNSITVGVQ